LVGKRADEAKDPDGQDRRGKIRSQNQKNSTHTLDAAVSRIERSRKSVTERNQTRKAKNIVVL